MLPSQSCATAAARWKRPPPQVVVNVVFECKVSVWCIQCLCPVLRSLSGLRSSVDDYISTIWSTEERSHTSFQCMWLWSTYGWIRSRAEVLILQCSTKRVLGMFLCLCMLSCIMYNSYTIHLRCDGALSAFDHVSVLLDHKAGQMHSGNVACLCRWSLNPRNNYIQSSLACVQWRLCRNKTPLYTFRHCWPFQRDIFSGFTIHWLFFKVPHRDLWTYAYWIDVQSTKSSDGRMCMIGHFVDKLILWDVPWYCYIFIHMQLMCIDRICLIFCSPNEIKQFVPSPVSVRAKDLSAETRMN